MSTTDLVADSPPSATNYKIQSTPTPAYLLLLSLPTSCLPWLATTMHISIMWQTVAHCTDGASNVGKSLQHQHFFSVKFTATSLQIRQNQESNGIARLQSLPEDWLCTTRRFAIAGKSTFCGRRMMFWRNSPRHTSHLSTQTHCHSRWTLALVVNGYISLLTSLEAYYRHLFRVST